MNNGFEKSVIVIPVRQLNYIEVIARLGKDAFSETTEFLTWRQEEKGEMRQRELSNALVAEETIRIKPDGEYIASVVIGRPKEVYGQIRCDLRQTVAIFTVPIE